MHWNMTSGIMVAILRYLSLVADTQAASFVFIYLSTLPIIAFQY